MAKFHIGDRFTPKHTRDTIPIEIVKVSYYPHEPVYELKQIILENNTITLGEEALIDYYDLLNKN